MAAWSIIKKSELEEGARIDAEYYHPKYLSIIKLIKGGSYYRLYDLIEKFNSGINLPQTEKNSIKFLRTQHIGEIIINDRQNLTYCNITPNADYLLRKGDLLIGRVGAAGRCVVANIDYEGHFYSDNVVRLRLVNKINPFYVCVFLNSEMGKLQIEKVLKGVAQPLLSKENLESVYIPDIDLNIQKQFEKIVSMAYLKRKEYQTLYLQAEQMLLAKLELDKIGLSQSNYYSIPLKKVQRGNRADTEHFQPKYDKLIQHLKKIGKTKSLGEIASYIKRGLQPIYVEDGEVIVVNSQHLGRYLLNIEATERTDYVFWQGNKRARLQKEDVLLYSTGAYIGRTNVWLEEIKGIASNHVTIIRPKQECNPFYLAVYLNTLPGLQQAEKWATGSGQREIYPEAIANFLIYLPSKQFQAKIANLATQSYDARKRAKTFLEEAKKSVEEMIMKGKSK